MLPPVPTNWDGFHPLFVHFPIGILLTVPLLIILSLAFHRHRAGLGLAAWVMMFVGTLGATLAVNTGEAAGELARSPAIEDLLHHHEELAEASMIIFWVLTAVYGILLLLPATVWRSAKRLHLTLVTLVFLSAYTVGMGFLANTAHWGGQLVHGMGVVAVMLYENPQEPPPADSHEEDD